MDVLCWVLIGIYHYWTYYSFFSRVLRQTGGQRSNVPTWGGPEKNAGPFETNPNGFAEGQLHVPFWAGSRSDIFCNLWDYSVRCWKGTQGEGSFIFPSCPVVPVFLFFGEGFPVKVHQAKKDAFCFPMATGHLRQCFVLTALDLRCAGLFVFVVCIPVFSPGQFVRTNQCQMYLAFVLFVCLGFPVFPFNQQKVIPCHQLAWSLTGTLSL